MKNIAHTTITERPNAPQRICLISTHGYVAAEPQLGQPDTGGQVVYVLEVAKALRDQGCTVDVVTRGFGGQPEVDDMGERLRVLRIPFGGEKFIVKENFHNIVDEGITNFLRKIKQDDLQYELISSHYWDAGVIGQAVAEELQIPHVHTPHSLGAWKRDRMKRDATDKQMKVYRFDERIAAEQAMYDACDAMIATTHQQEDRIHSYYNIPLEKIAVLPAGLDDKRFFPVEAAALERARQKHDVHETDVLALGRMARNKGYDLLIQALPDLINVAPKTRLVVFIGHEDSEQDQLQINELKQLAHRLGVLDRISWRGHVLDEDLPDVYRAAGVYALPSRYEPFGMTAVEAMACGTPTVITVHGGLKDAVKFGTHALFADPNVPGELATQLSMPLRYPEIAQQMGTQGMTYARKEFAWSGIAGKMLILFAAVATDHTVPDEESLRAVVGEDDDALTDEPAQTEA